MIDYPTGALQSQPLAQRLNRIVCDWVARYCTRYLKLSLTHILFLHLGYCSRGVTAPLLLGFRPFPGYAVYARTFPREPKPVISEQLSGIDTVMQQPAYKFLDIKLIRRPTATIPSHQLGFRRSCMNSSISTHLGTDSMNCDGLHRLRQTTQARLAR